MSELFTNDEHVEEQPDVRADEDLSSSTNSGTVPTDESLNPTTMENTSIVTLFYGDDNRALLVFRTSPVRDKNPLLVDIFDPSTTPPTGYNNLDATEHTSACSVVSDPCMITHDHQIEPFMSIPSGNDDYAAPGTSNTISTHQFPVSIPCNIAVGLSNATYAGCYSLGTSSNSPTVAQAEAMTTKTYRQQPSFQSRSMWDSRTQWEHHAAGIQPSTSQAVNVIRQPNTTIFGDPRCNIPGSRNPMNQPYMYRPCVVGTRSKCRGNMKPGVVRLDELYNTYTGDEKYECVLCGCQFTSENGLERHRRNMHFIFKINDPDLGEGMYECRCGCQFRLQEFHEHIRNIHKDRGELVQICNVCQRRLHTGEKPFKCKECPFERSFWHAEDLEWHYRIHKNDAPFKCYSCGKGFWRKILLNAHKPGY